MNIIRFDAYKHNIIMIDKAVTIRQNFEDDDTLENESTICFSTTDTITVEKPLMELMAGVEKVGEMKPWVAFTVKRHSDGKAVAQVAVNTNQILYIHGDIEPNIYINGHTGLLHQSVIHLENGKQVSVIMHINDVLKHLMA